LFFGLPDPAQLRHMIIQTGTSAASAEHRDAVDKHHSARYCLGCAAYGTIRTHKPIRSRLQDCKPARHDYALAGPLFDSRVAAEGRSDRWRTTLKNTRKND